MKVPLVSIWRGDSDVRVKDLMGFGIPYSVPRVRMIMPLLPRMS